MAATKWTQEEDDILREEYGHTATSLLAEKLDRSYQAVKTRAMRLGFAKGNSRRRPLKQKEIPKELRGRIHFDSQAYMKGGSQRNWAVIVDCPICESPHWVIATTIRSGIKRGNWTGCCRPCAIAYRKTWHFGLANPAWRGGRHASKAKYVWRSLSSFEFDQQTILRSMCKNYKRSTYSVFEHRAVVALALGRPLARNEYVHHINGDRADNRLENLRLVDHHKQQICPHCGHPMELDEYVSANNR